MPSVTVPALGDRPLPTPGWAFLALGLLAGLAALSGLAQAVRAHAAGEPLMAAIAGLALLALAPAHRLQRAWRQPWRLPVDPLSAAAVLPRQPAIRVSIDGGHWMLLCVPGPTGWRVVDARGAGSEAAWVALRIGLHEAARPAPAPAVAS